MQYKIVNSIITFTEDKYIFGDQREWSEKKENKNIAENMNEWTRENLLLWLC